MFSLYWERIGGKQFIRNHTALYAQVENDQLGFEAVVNPIEMYRLIRAASRDSARVDVYFTRSNARLVTEVIDSAVLGPGITFRKPSGYTPTVRDDECMAIVFLHGHTLLCLHSSNVEWQGDTFRILPRWRAFTLQRRKQARVDIPAGYEILADLDSREGRRRRVQRRVLDISPGGLAFEAANQLEASRYRKGQVLRHVAIRIEDRLIFVDARVSREASSRGLKVGLQFTRMSQRDRDFLVSFVARHIVQYAS